MAFFTTSDHTKIYYEDFGNGERTIVFLHGLRDSHASFKERADRLAEKYRIIVYDQRAHGRSDVPRAGYTIPRLAQDLQELIDHLGLGRVILIGYSLGVHVLYDYVKQFGETHIDSYVLSVMSPKIITDENYKLGLNGNFPYEDAMRFIRKTKRYYPLIRLLGAATYSGDKKYKKQVAAFYKRARTMKKMPMVQLNIALAKGDYWPTLDTMTRPALVIAGENDIYPVETHETVCARLTDAKLAIIPDAGHLVLLERPDAYMKEIEDFLNGPASR